MKNLLIITLLTFPVIASGQMSALSVNNVDGYVNPNPYYLAIDDESISRFAITLNPLGVVQFGPFVGMEIGLTDFMALNVHTRIARFGVLSYVVREADKITGFSIGTGPMFFFGERRNKPYVGVLFEFERAKCLYSENSSWENTETETNLVFISNGGYRFRFSSGFFLSTGLYFGFARVDWVEEFTDPSIRGSEGTNIRPFGMVEFTLGFEF